MESTLVKTPGTLAGSLPPNTPEEVLEFSSRAAKCFMRVIDNRKDKVIINGRRYLRADEWETLGRMFNITAGISKTKSTTNENGSFGFIAHAIAKNGNGIEISSADAACFRDEKKWSDKPSYMLLSMASTRAISRVYRSLLSGVVLLAGYEPCSAEDMDGVRQPIGNSDSVNSFDEPAESADEYTELDARNDQEEQERLEEERNKITAKQEKFLRELILEKVEDEEEKNERLANLCTLTKFDASQAISQLIGEPSYSY